MKVIKRPVVVEAEQFDGMLLPGMTVQGGVAGVETREGFYRAERGDWIVTGVAGERWPVSAERFAALYEPIGAGRFRSRPQVRDALRMPSDFAIFCSGGTLTGKAGDWLVLATPDDAYPVAAEIFAATYEVVEE